MEAGYIFCFIIGGFLGMLGMALAVICRKRKRPDLLEARKEIVSFCESKEHPMECEPTGNPEIYDYAP